VEIAKRDFDIASKGARMAPRNENLFTSAGSIALVCAGMAGDDQNQFVSTTRFGRSPFTE
jgi:hypothetical protein